MSPKSKTCVARDDLIAAATGDAGARIVGRVDHHVAHCEPCREEYARYRAIDAVVGELRSAPVSGVELARERLLTRLADLRTRLVRYTVFASPLGRILIAATEDGVALVEYLGRSGAAGSSLFRQSDLEPQAAVDELERFHIELMDCLVGRRTHLAWPLDLRLATSDFQRAVLRATASLPYGTVSSYAGIAQDIGKPRAVRAVAQALRRNPLAIIVPCHRIIGSGGSLVGYAGHRIALKARLLGVEGVRTEHRHHDARVDRYTMYAWDRSSREYCLPTCGDISRRPIGRVTLFASRREAKTLGLHPCSDCRPDLHPLHT